RRLSDANRPLEDLLQRLARIQVAAHCLRRLLAPNTQWPATLEVTALASELNLAGQTVEAGLGDLVRHGVGSLQDHRWSVPGREALEELAVVLCRYAAEPVGVDS